MPEHQADKLSLVPVLERLEQLSQLEPDWDSYGAEPVSSIALIKAIKILEIVKENLSAKTVELLPSFIAPLADGGLQLEWSSLQGEIEIEIDPNGDLNYVLIEGKGTHRKFEEKHQASLNEILNLLFRFLSL